MKLRSFFLYVGLLSGLAVANSADAADLQFSQFQKKQRPPVAPEQGRPLLKAPTARPAAAQKSQRHFDVAEEASGDVRLRYAPDDGEHIYRFQTNLKTGYEAQDPSELSVRQKTPTAPSVPETPETQDPFLPPQTRDYPLADMPDVPLDSSVDMPETDTAPVIAPVEEPVAAPVEEPVAAPVDPSTTPTPVVVTPTPYKPLTEEEKAFFASYAQALNQKLYSGAPFEPIDSLTFERDLKEGHIPVPAEDSVLEVIEPDLGATQGEPSPRPVPSVSVDRLPLLEEFEKGDVDFPSPSADQPDQPEQAELPLDTPTDSSAHEDLAVFDALKTIAPVEGEAGSSSASSHADAISFEVDSAEVSARAHDLVRSFSAQLKASSSSYLQLTGYASSDSAASARRLAYERVLAVRDLFLEEGLDSSQIYILAKGNEAVDGAPVDRVALAVMKR